MSTLFFLCLWVYACVSLEVVQEINECLEDFVTNDNTNCVISLDPSTSHQINGDIDTNFTNPDTNITNTLTIIITSSNTPQQATILVQTSVELTLKSYGIDLTFNYITFDGSPQASNCLEIYTNQRTQLNLFNSQMMYFNSSKSAIYIEETINSFSVNSATHDTTVDINVKVTNINKTDAFVTVHFENSAFSDNTNTASNGGVLSLIGHEFQLEINNCNFTNNQVTALRKNGGCLSWDRSSVPDPLYSQIDEVTDSIDTTTKEITGTYYPNYEVTDGVSDIWMISSRVEITNSIFSDNKASDAGGVMYIIQPQVYDTQIFSISESIEVDTNTSYTIAGNLSIVRYFELYSENNVFQRNTAGQYGGVYRHWGYALLQDEFSSTLMCDDRHYQITMINDVFTENSIPVKESQTFAYGAVLSSTCSQVTAQHVTFTSNAARYGSTLSIYASSEVLIDDCEFVDNNCTFGTLYINGLLDDEYGYDVSITRSQFVNNRAANDGAAVLAIIVSDVVINGCYFENNENVYGGTASFHYFQNFNPMHVEITESQFISNTVDSDDVVSGGAISAIRYDYEEAVYPLNCYEDETGFDSSIEGLTLDIDECEFENNSESAIGLSVVSAYISRCTFRNNANSESHGGAIKSAYSWFKVIDSRFISNTASKTGGAISTGVLTYTDTYNNWELPTKQDNQPCDVEVESSNFTQNTAELGGALLIGNIVTLKHNNFANNVAQYGGAVAVSSSFMTMLENTFFNNSAETHGGCVFQTQYSNDDMSASSDIVLWVHDNTFSSCRALSGGAIFLRTQINQILQINNNLFADNTAETVGGALAIAQLLPVSFAIEDGSTIDTMNTFENNSASNFNDFISYPAQMYILSDDGAMSVSPGISATASLGAYDIFGQNFVSFMVTDWNAKEENFEFYLQHDDAFELLTVNSGSLSAGEATISFVISTGNRSTVAITYLGSNMPSLIATYNASWQLVKCPTGYGYNETTQTCNLCQRDTFKVEDGWTQCLPCLVGLSCRGGEHVQILYKNWWSSNFSSSKATFFCRLGECCTSQDGCSPEAAERCPDDRDPESIGCGKCSEGYSAIHGSHKCADCSALGEATFFTGAIVAFVLWPLLLVFLFGLAQYDADSEAGNLCRSFYSVSIIEITIIVLIDYYQSLPAILTFVPDSGTYFLMNVFFARIPVTANGLCLFHGMTILQKTYWDLLIPSVILILSLTVFAISYLLNSRQKSDTEDAKNKERINLFKLGKTGWVYDPLRGIMFSLFFCIVPMLWSCSHLFKCIEYGETNRFWNAPGEECNGYIVAIMALLFVALSLIYIVSNIYYSNYHLIGYKDIEENKRLIPLYLQRVQPFYFMVYPFTDKNTRRSSKIDQTANLTWQNIKFREQKDFKYLYVGWISPFLRKFLCLIAHAVVTGPKGQSDQTFIVTNLTLATLVLYQLFSQDYTSIDNYTLHLYCMYLLYWLVLLIVSGSTKIISENMDTMQSLKSIVNVIMWIPLACAVIAISWAILLLCKPEFMARRTIRKREDVLQKAKTKKDPAFHSAISVIGPASAGDDNKEVSKSDNNPTPE